MAGIAKISQLKAKYGSPFPSMELNFLAMRSNVSELPKLVTMAKEVGATQINVFYPGMGTEDMVDECVWFCQEYSDSWLAKSKMIADSIDMKLRLPPLFRNAPTWKLPAHGLSAPTRGPNCSLT